MGRLVRFVFLYTNSQQFSENTATLHLQGLCASAGIAGATAQSGRLTWLANLIPKRIRIRVMAIMAGHRSIQPSERYIDVNDA